MKKNGAGTKRVDMPLLLAVLALVLFGMVMLYSTSSYNGRVKFGDSFYYLKKWKENQKMPISHLPLHNQNVKVWEKNKVHFMNLRWVLR